MWSGSACPPRTARSGSCCRRGTRRRARAPYLVCVSREGRETARERGTKCRSPRDARAPASRSTGRRRTSRQSRPCPRTAGWGWGWGCGVGRGCGAGMGLVWALGFRLGGGSLGVRLHGLGSFASGLGSGLRGSGSVGVKVRVGVRILVGWGWVIPCLPNLYVYDPNPHGHSTPPRARTRTAGRSTHREPR